MKFIFIFIFIFVPFQVHSAIVLNGTRIVYPEGAKEVTIQAQNKDSRPFAAQVWVDLEGSEENPSMPGEIKTPFFVTPSISRIAPNAGQAIRVIYTGADLPSDRESVFYFNLLQIPPVAAGQVGRNTFQVMVKDRLKLFYRPRVLEGKSNEVSARLMFSLISQDGGLFVKVVNPTGYYASFAETAVVKAGTSYVVGSSMVAPFSEQLWSVASGLSDVMGVTLEAKLINDYGGLVSISYKL